MLDDISTVGVADVGYDGIAVIVNGRLVTHIEELEDVLKGDGFINVKFIFTEAKMTDIIQQEAVRSFYEAVLSSFEYALGRREIDIQYYNVFTACLQS